MKTLYYTVEKQTTNLDGIEECTGWKTISVYEIVLDKPKLWFELDAKNEDSSENEIQEWLDSNGFEDREYEFERL
jgi:hypothetical protein